MLRNLTNFETKLEIIKSASRADFYRANHFILKKLVILSDFTDGAVLESC
jgi:hypothetical protein